MFYWICQIWWAFNLNGSYLFFILSRSLFPAMGSQAYANVCPHFASKCIAQYTENIWEISDTTICNICWWYVNNAAIHRWNDCQNAHSRHVEGKIEMSIMRSCKKFFISIDMFFLFPLFFFFFFAANFTWRCSILSRSLVSVWCFHGAFSLVINIAASPSINGDCFEIFVFIDITFTAPIDYDSIFTCIFKIFYAKKSN